MLYFNVTGDIVSLADTMTQPGLREDSSLDWLEIQGGMRLVNIGTTIAMATSHVASILFFFYTRHRGGT